MDMVCDVLGEEEETNGEEDEERDGLSQGTAGLYSVDTDSPSPGEDADTKGERERERKSGREGGGSTSDPRVLTRDWICCSRVLS